MRRQQAKVPAKVQDQVLNLIWAILTEDYIPEAKKRINRYYGNRIYVEIDYLKKHKMGYNRMHKLLDVAGLEPRLSFKYEEVEI